MTYGWSILIISIALVSLYYLGIFNTSSGFPTGCIPIQGFLCNNLILSTGGMLTLGIGNAAGEQMNLNGIACSNSTTEPTYFQPISLNLQEGQSTTIKFQCAPTQLNVGNFYGGKIWLSYTNQYGQEQIINYATFSAKVVTIGPSEFQVINTINVGSNPYAVAFNPSGTLAYVVNAGSNTLSIINPITNTTINTITTPFYSNGGSFFMALNPLGTIIYVTNYENPSSGYARNTVSVINPSTNTTINSITVGYAPLGVEFNPSGTLAYVVNQDSGTISVINPSTNTIINTITVGTYPYSITFNPSGTLAYVTIGNSDIVSVINPLTNTVVNTITVGSAPVSAVFNPSGTLAYVSNEGSNTVSVINPSTNTVINTITVGTNPYSVALNPYGTMAYVANAGSNTLSVINTMTNTVVNTITVGYFPVYVTLNPSGTLVYVANNGDNTISVINT